MRTGKKQALTLLVHSEEVRRAAASARELGMGIEEYSILAIHLVTTAFLNGSATASVPDRAIKARKHGMNTVAAPANFMM
ncbi:hypothetical protein D9M72_184410 [compost metagenome]